MSNHTYNKDDLKYLHHLTPLSKKKKKDKERFKKGLEVKIKKVLQEGV